MGRYPVLPKKNRKSFKGLKQGWAMVGKKERAQVGTRSEVNVSSVSWWQ